MGAPLADGGMPRPRRAGAFRPGREPKRTTKGSCPEMIAAWTAALEIAEVLDDADYRLRALWGLYVDCITSGRYPAALAAAERFCTFAAKTTDPADGAIGDRLV